MDESKKEYREKVMSGFKKMTSPKDEGGLGIKPEFIAIHLHCTCGTIKNWCAGRRVPKRSIVERAQDIFRVNIL